MLHYLLQVFRIVPFPLLYGLSDAMAFVFQHLLRYRKKVIDENLKRAFPDFSPSTGKTLIRAIYRNLSDVTLETLKSFSLSPAEMARRCRCENPELLNRLAEQGQSVLLMGSHLANWEYSGLALPLALKGKVVLVYKPLSNKRMDAYLNQARARTGADTVAMDDLFREMRRRMNEPMVYVLLSDQSPSSRKSAHWLPFFGQDTACLPGADVLARKFGFPVYAYRVKRTNRRGFYSIHFAAVSETPAQQPETAITRLYTEQLEKDIRNTPEQWLWSHKRWKMKR